MTLKPFFVNFSADALDINDGGVEVRCVGAEDAGSHYAFDGEGFVRVLFPAAPQTDELTLTFRGLVSRNGPLTGHAPLDILVNGRSLVSRYRIPGGGDLPQDVTFSVPGDWLQDGRNELILRSAADAETKLWLYEVLLESVWDRNHARIELLKHANRLSALAYRTLTRRFDDRTWQDGAPLRLRIENGDSALPVELTWRGWDGSEATISFEAKMADFTGQLRTAAGEWHQFRGELIERGPTPWDPARALRFETATNWGDGWRSAPDLHLYVDGVGQLERIGWRNERGRSASIVLSEDGTSFLGHSQDVDEGAVEYRGTAAPQPDARHGS